MQARCASFERYPSARFSNVSGAVRLRHLAVVERLVEGLLVDALIACDLAQRAARRRRFLDDLSSLVVADVRVERGGGGERQLRVVLALLAVRLDPVDALLREKPR